MEDEEMLGTSQGHGAAPSFLYTYRVSVQTVNEASFLIVSQAPSPPHISVPPLPEMSNIKLPPSCPLPSSADFEDEAMAQLLKYLTSGLYQTCNPDWVYDNRRDAHPILPFLYLGPFTKAKDIDFLTKEGITMLLVVRDERTALSGLLSGKKVAEQLGLAHAAVDVAGSAQLVQFGFSKAIRLINNHILEKYAALAPDGPIPAGPPYPAKPPVYGKVLIFCESGNERSAAVVAAYLVVMYGLGTVAAIQFIQSHRFCIAPNDELKNQLLNFQQVIEAQRRVSGDEFYGMDTRIYSRSSVGKRSYSEVHGDDDGEDDDAARFSSRELASAPFLDTN